MPQVDRDQLNRAYVFARDALIAERTPEGYWVGELSSSALSTATAVGALSLVNGNAELIRRGLVWLIEHQNEDGGWGDTIRSISNISTTMLCRSAFHIARVAEKHAALLQRAEAYLDAKCGSGIANHAEGIRKRYGKDRTFSVPILMTAALAGLVPWTEVPALPFELACFPQSWFRFLRMPVVSYALPALIAIGQVIYHHRPPRNPITWLIRKLSKGRSLKVLQRIQPSSGGFLEATPLTSFVVMSLAGIGKSDHPVAKKGIEFLINSVRPDGSWAIDTNLSVWVTALAVNALAAGGELKNLDRLAELQQWLLTQQFKERHPYTGSEPGGWGWTHLPGSVPDADDTPGALLALHNLTSGDRFFQADQESAIVNGIYWLRGLRNRDGGWPTFCRGWGTLPFDRSGPDLTAHVLRAFTDWCQRWFDFTPASEKLFLEMLDKREPESPSTPILEYAASMSADAEVGQVYLGRTQRPDGSWLPLWFGNQHAPNDENPTYGTARVLAAYRDLAMMDSEPVRRGIAWLLDAQNADGSWGGAKNVPGSVEETALAVEILLDADGASGGCQLPVATQNQNPQNQPGATATQFAVERGLNWLIEAIERDKLKIAEPIGFYFAKLWYFEKLYPMIFAVAALGKARRKLLETTTSN